MTPEYPWTPEQIDVLRREWAARTSSRRIGEMLGVSHHVVSGKAKRLRLERRTDMQGGQSTVPKSEKDLIRELWNARPIISTIEIAKRLGLTKGQVIGRAYRMKLEPRENPIPRKPTTPVIVPPVARPCQWIDGHPGTGQPWSFCGAECIDGTSWCSAHYADVYVVSPAELARRNAIGARLTAARKSAGVNGRAVA